MKVQVTGKRIDTIAPPAVIAGCCGELNLMGMLGFRAWYKCRFCGMEYSKEIKKVVINRRRVI